MTGRSSAATQPEGRAAAKMTTEELSDSATVALIGGGMIENSSEAGPSLGAQLEASAREFLGIFDALLAASELQFAPDLAIRHVVAKAVIERQTSALRAALLLGDQCLGNLATAFVRQAFEEQIWLAYVETLDAEPGERLLTAMRLNDALRGLAAFHNYAGADALRGVGFPSRFADAAGRETSKIRDDLRTLGQELGWPKGTVVPSTNWVAERVGAQARYDYLFAATSRAVHFSAGEAMRNSWWDSDGRIMMASERTRHQYAFALQQLINIAVRTFANALAIIGPTTSLAGPTEGRFTATVERFAEIKWVPLVITEEFNLSPRQRSRSRA
ncbi:hypothetical protein [Pseudofrankia saprophytica]|nr:hypothetical protein [Pseudofrankia saprophytica]